MTHTWGLSNSISPSWLGQENTTGLKCRPKVKDTPCLRRVIEPNLPVHEMLRAMGQWISLLQRIAAEAVFGCDMQGTKAYHQMT